MSPINTKFLCFCTFLVLLYHFYLEQQQKNVYSKISISYQTKDIFVALSHQLIALSDPITYPTCVSHM